MSKRDIALDLYNAFKGGRKNFVAKNKPETTRDAGEPKAIGELIDQLVTQRDWKSGLAEGEIFVRWREVVGEEIANSASGGSAGSQIASLGIPNATKGSTFGEPGVSKTKYKDTKSPLLWPEMMRRTLPNMVKENRDRFAGNAVFEVDSATFHAAKFHKRKGKHWRKYLGEDDCLSEIRNYANKHPGEPIVIKNKVTGEMCYARYGKGMKYVTEM